MGLIEFLMLATVAYLVWRISDQLPDLLFRISEIQRDVADIRKRLIDVEETTAAARPARKKAAKKSAAANKSAANKSAAKDSVVNKRAARDSAASKSTADKSAASKSAAKTDDNADANEPSS